MEIYTVGQFAKKLKKSVRTLQQWDRDGIFKAHRTPTGRRFYTEQDYNNFLGNIEYKSHEKDIQNEQNT